MERQNQERLRQRLMQSKRDLTVKLLRIHRNVQSGRDPDSAERAKQPEDSDVVDTLGKEATLELLRIDRTLRRLHDRTFDVCVDCGSLIENARLEADPYATECIDCVRRREGDGIAL